LISPQNIKLGVGEKKEISISFIPNNYKEYLDSIILTITEPCLTELGYKIQGRGTGKLKIWIPDTVSEIGIQNYHIPIYCKMETGKSEVELKISGEIENEYSLYKPNELMSEGITDKGILDNKRKIGIELPKQIISNNQKELGSIIGRILLANNNTTKIEIKKMEIDNPNISLETQDGSVTLVNSCVKDIQHIKFFQPVELHVNNIYNADEVSIKILTGIKGNYKLTVYSLAGISIESIEFTNNSKEKIERNIVLSKEKYSTGNYIIVLTNPMNVLSQRISIIK
jgi:hypothetical protein